MEYVCSYVKYDRRGDRVVPVRVTKAWVEPPEVKAKPGKQKVLPPSRRFIPVRVTELRMRDVRGGREAAPEAWESSHRVESRERLLGLVTRYDLEEGGEPVVVPLAAGEPALALGDLSALPPSLASQTLVEPDTRDWYQWQQWADLRGHGDE